MGRKTEVAPREGDEKWMAKALVLARQAEQLREVPVGAIVVYKNQVVGASHNCSILQQDATAHAEIRAIRLACETLCNYRLNQTTLYVTLEPCTMCLGAVIHSRIGRVVFATAEPRAGAIISSAALDFTSFNHSIEYTKNVMQKASADLLKAFFRARR